MSGLVIELSNTHLNCQISSPTKIGHLVCSKETQHRGHAQYKEIESTFFLITQNMYLLPVTMYITNMIYILKILLNENSGHKHIHTTFKCNCNWELKEMRNNVVKLPSVGVLNNSALKKGTQIFYSKILLKIEQTILLKYRYYHNGSDLWGV